MLGDLTLTFITPGKNEKNQNTAYQYKLEVNGSSKPAGVIFERRTPNIEHRTQNAECGTQKAEHRTQNAERGTRNVESRKQNAERRTTNSMGAFESSGLPEHLQGS